MKRIEKSVFLLYHRINLCVCAKYKSQKHIKWNGRKTKKHQKQKLEQKHVIENESNGYAIIRAKLHPILNMRRADVLNM